MSHRFSPDQSPSAPLSSAPCPMRVYEYPDSVILKLADRLKFSSAPAYGSGWDTRIPLSYGDRYGHLKWMKEHEEFCNIVEKNRIAAADRKYDTLAAISARSVSKNLNQISADALSCLPNHVLDLVADEIMADPRVLTTLKDSVWDGFPIRTLHRIWDGLYESQQINLHLWKVISPRLRAAKTNSGKELRLYRFDQQIETPPKSDSFYALTSPLISNTFDFITSLSIMHLLPTIDYIRLSSIVNLGTLEISEDPDRRVDTGTPSPIIDFDRVFRAWAAKAELGTAFRVLRSLRINILDSSLTTDILPHLNKFPALAIVYPGRILWPATKNGRKNKGKYISDYDFRSIRPLLPHGWKGVTIRGSKEGRTRGIADSVKYLPALNGEKKPSEVEFPCNFSIQGNSRLKLGKAAHDSLLTRFAGGQMERHCLHELLDFGLQQRLSDDSRQKVLGVNTSHCATPDAHVLWPGNFLREFSEEISTHEHLAAAVIGLQRTQEAEAPHKVNIEGHGTHYWELFHKHSNEKGPKFQDDEFPLDYTLDGSVGDIAPKSNLTFQRCSRSEECLPINGSKGKSYMNDAWDGRYISRTTSSDVIKAYSAQANTTGNNAGEPYQQEQKGRKARQIETSAAELKVHGKARLQAEPQISEHLSLKVPIIEEPIQPTTRDETGDLLKSLEHPSPSNESESCHEGQCQRHLTAVLHTSLPAPSGQCDNCNRDNSSDTLSKSEPSDISWVRHMSDLFGGGMDIDTYGRNTLPFIRHNSVDRTKSTFCNQANLHCASGLKAVEWRLHGQDVVEHGASWQRRDLKNGQRNFGAKPYKNIFGVPHPAVVEDATDDGQQESWRVAWDKGDKGYSISTEKVRLLEFGMLGLLRLDADLKAVGMDAGPAMLCLEKNGERILKVESKAPVVSVRIGQPQKWRSEGQTVLVREDLPTEEEKRGAKIGREKGKEELKAGSKPPWKKKEPVVKPRDEEAEKKRKSDKFNESFWELTGMAPSKRNKTD